MYIQGQEYAFSTSRNSNDKTIWLLPVDKLEQSLAKPICSVELHFSVVIAIIEVSMKAKPNGAAARDTYLKPFQQVHFVYQS